MTAFTIFSLYLISNFFLFTVLKHRANLLSKKSFGFDVFTYAVSFACGWAWPFYVTLTLYSAPVAAPFGLYMVWKLSK